MGIINYKNCIYHELYFGFTITFHPVSMKGCVINMASIYDTFLYILELYELHVRVLTCHFQYTITVLVSINI
jgi:hypothetical protein